MEELRSKVGLFQIPKTRPGETNLDKISVITPNYTQEAAGAQSSFQKSDTTALKETKRLEMMKFISNLAKNDKKLHDQLVAITKLCNKNDIDMRQLGQLRQPFFTKDGKEPLKSVP